VAALQALAQQVSELQADNDQLRADNDRLTAEIERLRALMRRVGGTIAEQASRLLAGTRGLGRVSEVDLGVSPR
jgi:cell division protein FtsB